MIITPVQDVVFVEIIEPVEAPKIGSVLVPGTSNGRPNIARVIAIGPLVHSVLGRTLEPGMVVAINPYKLLCVLQGNFVEPHVETPVGTVGMQALIRAEHVLGLFPEWTHLLAQRALRDRAKT